MYKKGLQQQQKEDIAVQIERKTVKGQNKTNIKTRFCCKEKKIIFQKLFSGLESDFLSSAFDLNETKNLK